MTLSAPDREIAHNALDGDNDALAYVRSIVTPIIEKRNHQLCKKFCSNLHRVLRCTVDEYWGSSNTTDPLCEWGNAGYEWMLSYLMHENRLRNFVSKQGNKLVNYLTVIAYSIPFLEKWKNFRFDRRIRVPVYVQVLDKDAGRMFYYLYDGDDVANIAQRLNRPMEDMLRLKHAMEAELARRHKLHLLFPTQVVSLQDEEKNEKDLEDFSLAPDSHLEKFQLHLALNKLPLVERFVLRAMDMDDIEAKDALYALQREKLNRHDGKTINKVDQIYYIRNKARKKLREFFHHGQEQNL